MFLSESSSAQIEDGINVAAINHGCPGIDFPGANPISEVECQLHNRHESLKVRLLIYCKGDDFFLDEREYLGR